MKTPECDKILAVKDKSHAIGEFLDWLQNTRKTILATYTGQVPGNYELFPELISIENLLAEYFEIDLEKVEIEKRAILEQQRELNRSYELLEILG